MYVVNYKMKLKNLNYNTDEIKWWNNNNNKVWHKSWDKSDEINLKIIKNGFIIKIN